MRIFPLLALLCLLSTGLAAQIPYSAPRSEAALLGVDNIQDIDQLMVYVEGIGSPSREALERQNIKAYMMPVRQATDARTEWAYALTSALEYYININQNYKDNLSPDLISLSLAAQGNRPNLEDGLAFLRDAGTVSAAIVPYGSPTIPTAVYSVPRHRIANFGYLFRPTTRARNRIFEVRKALSRGNPVIVEVATDADFNDYRTAEYAAGVNPAETHHLLVVGYDETTEQFELRGCKGRRWANSGYINISYEEFGRISRNAYVLFPVPQ